MGENLLAVNLTQTFFCIFYLLKCTRAGEWALDLGFCLFSLALLLSYRGSQWRSIIYKHNARWLKVSWLKANKVYSFRKTYNVKTHQLKPGKGAGIWWVMEHNLKKNLKQSVSRAEWGIILWLWLAADFEPLLFYFGYSSPP
jgi:hypothetical protein